MGEYSDWLTKQQAADAIGVSTKTVEKLADAKQLQQATLRRIGRPAIVVYHPTDVERVRKERNPDAEPFILTAPEEPETKAVTRASQTSQNPLAMLAAMAETMRPAAPVRVTERLFLTLSEASEYSGLPKGYLRELMAEGKLGMRVGRYWRIRRADLEKL